MLSQGLPDVIGRLTPHAVYNARTARELKGVLAVSVGLSSAGAKVAGDRR
jgi:hypothetical protein